MTIFEYKGVDASGNSVEGRLEAPEKNVVFRKLKEEGISPSSINESRGEGSSGGALFARLSEKFSSVGTQDKINFARNLGKMLSAGLPITRAISIMRRQAKNPRLSFVLASLEAGVNKGTTLHASMEKFPDTFSKLFISMVRAGEESGNLADSLTIVSKQMNNVYVLQKKIRGAMIYPAIIVSVMLVIAILMLVYIVPTLNATFSELNVELPMSTNLIIGVSEFIRDEWHLTILFIGLVIAGLAMARKTEAGKQFIDKVLVKMPIIGKITRESNVARTTRTLASLLSSGVEYVQAIIITEDVVQNTMYRAVLKQAGISVEKGGALSESWRLQEQLFPSFATEMVKVGEETGKLAEMLEGVATFYEDEVERSTKDMSTIIEPFLMVIIGVAVGFFAISMLSPMYSIADKI